MHLMKVYFLIMWDKVFENEPSGICGRFVEAFKKFEDVVVCLSRLYDYG